MPDTIPVDVPFGPLDTQGDPFALPPGTLTVAENVTIQNTNSYTTRRGYSQLATGPSTAVAALARGSEMAVIDGKRIWSYDPNGAAWPTQGTTLAVGEAVPARRAVTRVYGTTAVVNSSVAYTNGITAALYLSIDLANQGNPCVILYDANGQQVAQPFLLLNGATDYDTTQIVASGNILIVFAYSLLTTRVDAWRCDTTSKPYTFSASSAITTTTHATAVILDAVATVNGNIVAMWSKSGANGIAVALVDPTTLAVGTTATTASTLNNSFCGGGITGTTGENVYAAWYDTALGLRVWVLTTGAVSSSGPTVVEGATNIVDQIGLTRSDATHALLVWNRVADGRNRTSDGTLRDRIRWVEVSNTTGLGAIQDLYDLSLYSKPFVENGSFYFRALFATAPILTFTAVQQGTCFLMRISKDATAVSGSAQNRVAASMDCYRVGSYKPSSASERNGLSNVVSPSSGTWIASTRILYKSLAANLPAPVLDLVTYDMSSGARFQTAPIGQITHVAGGSVNEYDGARAQEVNFFTYPEGQRLTAAAAGGAMADGTYQYILIYEWQDVFGNAHQSTTSAVLSATIAASGGNGQITIDRIPNEPLIGQHTQDTTQVSIFRNAPTVSVGTFYQVISTAMTPGAVSLTVVDTSSDATISTHRQLYTTGGALDKEPPLACTALISHQNALWGISAEDPQLLFYSGDYTPGVAPWFSSGFQIRSDTGGPMIALASMDDKLVIFKNDLIFYINGQRPNATGANSSLSLPQLVSSDVGCIERRSIVTTGDGIYFLSRKGIYLLDRGLNVSFIGAPVDGYTSHYANCVAATLLSDRQEIRWEFTGPDGLATWSQVPRKIVYDYFNKWWTTHLNYTSLVPVTAVGGDAIRYTWFTSTGAAYQELAANSQQVDPSTTFIPFTLEMAWLAPAGPQGMSRVQYLILLGNYVSAHGTTIEVGRNYVGSYPMSKSFTNAITSGLGNNQVVYNLPQQQGEAYHVRISTYADGSSGSYGASMTAVGIRLVAIPKRGSFNKFMAATAKG